MIIRNATAVLASVLSLTAACDGMEVGPTPEVAVTRAPLDRPIDAQKELFITHLNVVQSPKLTTYKPGKWNTDPDGAWSFGRLMDNLQSREKPNDRERSDFTMRWLRTWESDQTVNGQLVPARPLVRSVVIDPWKQRSIGKLPGNTASSCAPGAATDFTCKLSFVAGVVPFKLIAIVNRPDLRVVPPANNAQLGSAGQGRFVFMLVDQNQAPLPFTAIFEYMVPVSGISDIKAYAEKWHKQGNKPFDNKFNDELQKITNHFTKWNVAPWRNNGSALLQLRVNDVALAEPGSDPDHPFGVLWEMREFIVGGNGQLQPDTTKQEPRIDLSGTDLLAQWVEDNSAAILANTHVVPPTFEGEPFLAASSFVPNLFKWEVPGASEEVRKAFALNTCNGCHRNETDTFFLHVFPLDPNTQEATLSAFLANELAEPGGVRVLDLKTILEEGENEVKNGKGKDHKH